jgi:hypothetical protein
MVDFFDPYVVSGAIERGLSLLDRQLFQNEEAIGLLPEATDPRTHRVVATHPRPVVCLKPISHRLAIGVEDYTNINVTTGRMQRFSPPSNSNHPYSG